MRLTVRGSAMCLVMLHLYSRRGEPPVALQEKLYSVFRLRRGPGPMISALTGGTAQWSS